MASVRCAKIVTAHAPADSRKKGHFWLNIRQAGWRLRNGQ